jgi:hypothetical protein
MFPSIRMPNPSIGCNVVVGRVLKEYWPQHAVLDPLEATSPTGVPLGVGAAVFGLDSRLVAIGDVATIAATALLAPLLVL